MVMKSGTGMHVLGTWWVQRKWLLVVMNLSLFATEYMYLCYMLLLLRRTAYLVGQAELPLVNYLLISRLPVRLYYVLRKWQTGSNNFLLLIRCFRCG